MCIFEKLQKNEIKFIRSFYTSYESGKQVDVLPLGLHLNRLVNLMILTWSLIFVHINLSGRLDAHHMAPFLFMKWGFSLKSYRKSKIEWTNIRIVCFLVCLFFVYSFSSISLRIKNAAPYSHHVCIFACLHILMIVRRISICICSFKISFSLWALCSNHVGLIILVAEWLCCAALSHVFYWWSDLRVSPA